MERAPKPKTSMTHSEPSIKCSNPHCEASNNIEARFCHRCKTPVIKRYLWATAEAIPKEQVKHLIGDRYFALTTRIFLDTRPLDTPQTPEENPRKIVTYLQLFPYYPHIPLVYGQLEGSETWLLDYGTVPTNKSGKLKYYQLIPELSFLWRRSTPLQQLNWLRQIAKLWNPLANKNAVSTLLTPELIRVNGQLIQLLQLKFDDDNQPSLQNLGQMWSGLVEAADPSIQGMLQQLCNRLSAEKIVNAEQIMAVLDAAMELCRRTQKYSYQVYALTDSGPSRTNNEDAAYPTADVPIINTQKEDSLAIVCDGVGGHDGGEIAAKETIDYLKRHIAKLSFEDTEYDSVTVIKQLTEFINGSNDLISERNDAEQRQERQRMGTTLVMTLAHAHEIYLAHVGDSRIYWITPSSCHQVTIDDDLASREVRLGYAVYRDSLKYPSAGALIQALGMRDSVALHPNLQRHIIHEDCIFLLCTDGLSDFDRVEQHWKHTILPVLNGTKDLAYGVETLVKIANQRNGHDNVTVALVHCKVKPRQDVAKATISWSDVEIAIAEAGSWSDVEPAIAEQPKKEVTETEIPEPKLEAVEPEKPSTNKKSSQWLKSFVLLLIVCITIGGILYTILQQRIDRPEKSPQQLPPEIETNEPEKSLPQPSSETETPKQE